MKFICSCNEQLYRVIKNHLFSDYPVGYSHYQKEVDKYSIHDFTVVIARTTSGKIKLSHKIISWKWIKKDKVFKVNIKTIKKDK